MKKNGTVKKVLKHLKEDEQEYKKMIADDKKLNTALKAKRTIHKKPK